MKSDAAISPVSMVQRCSCPVISEMLRPRVVALVIAATGAAQLLASNFHVGLPCTFYATTGLPCPGCGLTRSVLALLHGHAGDALRWHPFGPLLFAGLALSLAMGVLPEKVREKMLAAVRAVEARSAVIPLLLILFGLFYLIRIVGLFPLPHFPDWQIPPAPA